MKYNLFIAALLTSLILSCKSTKEHNGDGYIPSKIGRTLGVDKKTGFEYSDFGGRKYAGNKKVLVLCTEKRYFKMTNGKLFSTGNNVQETMVPLMHLVNAGFDFDVVTSTGSPAVLEEWSKPKKDKAVLEFMADHKEKFDSPKSLEELKKNNAFADNSEYIAVFLPGGHGAMVGLPQDENVGSLIRWTKEADKHLIAVCHGPAAMLAASNDSGKSHPYSGYKMVAFPDELDQKSPKLGYLPGDLPWYQVDELEKQGIEVINDDKVKGATHVDRKLLSGDSPKACDDLGKLAVEALLEELDVK